MPSQIIFRLTMTCASDKTFSNRILLKNMPEPALMPVHTIIIGPDGEFFLSDEFNHRIVVISPDGSCKRIIGQRGSDDGQFWYPRGLCIGDGKDGHELLVCDSWNHRIQRFDLDGKFLGSFGSIGIEENQFNEPVEIHPGTDNDVWILDRCNHRLKRHLLGGEFCGGLGEYMKAVDELKINDSLNIFIGDGEYSYGFEHPMAFVRANDGSFIICDTGHRRLCHIAQDGQLLGIVNLDSVFKVSHAWANKLYLLNDSFVMVGAIDGAFKIVNIKKPWLSREVDIGSGANNCVFVSDCANGGQELSFYSVDAARGEIGKIDFSLGQSVDGSESPPPFPKHTVLDEVPNAWTDNECEFWQKYLSDSSHGQEFDENSTQFMDTCFSSLFITLKKIMGVEEELCKALINYFDALQNLQNSKNIQHDQHSISIEHDNAKLLCVGLESKRRLFRKALITTISSMCNFLSNEHISEGGSRMRSQLIKLMESEYEKQKNDFKTVIDWLKPKIENASTLVIQECIHSFATLLFLLDYLSLVRETLARLKGEDYSHDILEHEQIIRRALYAHRTSLVNITNTKSHDGVFFLIAVLANVFRHLDAELLALRAVVHGETDEIKIMQVNDLYFHVCRLGMTMGAMAQILVNIAQEIDGYKGQIPLLILLIQRECEPSLSKDIFGRIKKESIKDKWESDYYINLETKQCLIENPPHTISLRHNHSLNETKGDHLEANVDVTYVESLDIFDEVTGNPIKPSIVLEASPTELLISQKKIDIYSSHSLYSYKKDRGCASLVNEPIMINSMNLAPSGDLLVLELIKKESPETKLSLMNMESGKFTVIDYKNKEKQNFPETPHKILSGGQQYYISDLANKQVWAFDKSFNSGKLILSPPHSPYLMYANLNKLVIGYLGQNAVSIVDLETMESFFIDDKYLVLPAAAYISESGFIYVISGTGLQIFDRQGKYIVQIDKLLNGNHVYPIDNLVEHSARISRFGDGNLAISDSINCKIHILKVS